MYNKIRKSDFMKLIVGLGNPGVNYEHTRHNCGFEVLDYLSEYYQIPMTQNKWQGVYGKGKIEGEDVILLKPQTFMNLSGESVIQVMSFYKLTHEDVLVIYDDMDLEVGKMRFRKKGSSAGHNGIKNIIAHLHTDTFDRVKVGIGKPQYGSVIDYVLGKFTKDEWEAIVDLFPSVIGYVKTFLK